MGYILFWVYTSIIIRKGQEMSTIHTPKYRAFLARLIATRKAAGLTQEQVASALSKPQSYISKCEQGERRLDVIECAELAEMYGVGLDELLP